MATKSTLVLTEETQLYAALNQPQPIAHEVWSTIYTVHYRHVLQICRRFFRQPEDAEDAAAEVFLKLHRVLYQKDETLPFRPWVSKVAGRHCIDKLRLKKREKSSSLEEIDPSGVADCSNPSPLSQILLKDEQRRVREQLTRLPEKYKVPLMLRYYKRMSYLEIARTLNTRLPAVRMMLFRAKDYLRRKLRHEPPGKNWPPQCQQEVSGSA
ncbi:MAG TPA: RNA polymerase sigma factor [Candidatus Acidoferrales bacterium]|jgi:RNA polymerase sigma-70 factor (ECF subfamily)|nr:RNA polymerase sigma factor [Candidatus Acidoferrales bacterium]